MINSPICQTDALVGNIMYMSERDSGRSREERRQWYRCINLCEKQRQRAADGRRGENTGVIDFWCLYFMLKIGWYIQAVWSMRAVVLRKNLSKCVISPLMEHRRKAILLIRPSPSPSFSFCLSFELFPCSLLPSLPPILFMLLDVSISLPALHLSTFPVFFFFFFKEWLSSDTVLDGGAVTVGVYLPHGYHNSVCVCVQCIYTHLTHIFSIYMSVWPLFIPTALSALVLVRWAALQTWCEQWIETEQQHYRGCNGKKKKKKLENKWGGGLNGAALLMCKR